MKRKDIQSYEIIYNFLKENFIFPKSFILDFEQEQFQRLEIFFLNLPFILAVFILDKFFDAVLKKLDCKIFTNFFDFQNILQKNFNISIFQIQDISSTFQFLIRKKQNLKITMK
ncbi:hypothetical protein DMUE_5155 [Dictyocoela muelleri]|nr:hypothetical protein DMUE_5155 [Dictyocoela muelleri]